MIEIKCTINVMCFNHSKTIHTLPSANKLSSTKLVPGAEKIGDCCTTDRTGDRAGYHGELVKVVSVLVYSACCNDKP